MHTLQLVFQGCRHLASSNTGKPCLHTTPAILRRIRASLKNRAEELGIVILWATCCTAFFGFFRAGKITDPSLGSYNPSQHLSFRDIATDPLQAPKMICVHLKLSRQTRSVGWGANISRPSGQQLVPYILAYTMMKDVANPLFRRSNKDP